MSKKTRLGWAVLGLMGLMVSSASIYAAKDGGDNYTLPQAEGVYDVPGRPELKLKVTVYHGKQGGMEQMARGDKSQPQPAPTLVCQASASADPDSASVPALAGWKLPANWTYAVNPSSAPVSLGASKANALIGKAYTSWQKVLGDKVTFQRGADTRKVSARLDGQNIVAWGTAENTALAVTYTWYNQNTGYATEIDTIMNSKFSWSWSDPASWTAGETCAYQGVYDAEDILTHELGHTVGLSDEYADNFKDNTMYGYGSMAETKKDTQTAGDVSAATALYQAL